MELQSLVKVYIHVYLLKYMVLGVLTPKVYLYLLGPYFLLLCKRGKVANGNKNIENKKPTKLPVI